MTIVGQTKVMMTIVGQTKVINQKLEIFVKNANFCKQKIFRTELKNKIKLILFCLLLP